MILSRLGFPMGTGLGIGGDARELCPADDGVCSGDALGSKGVEERARVRSVSEGAPASSSRGGSSIAGMFLDRLVCEGILSLREEDLPANYGPSHVDDLQRALEARTGIHSLRIGDVGPVVARHFAEALLRAPHIVDVRFTGPRVDDALAKVLGVMLQPIWLQPVSLQRLIIANPVRNQLSDHGAMRIAWALQDNQTLRTLVLSSTRLGDATMHTLTEALNVNQVLETLVFNGKHLSGDGVNILSDWLVSGQIKLRELVIGGVLFGDAGAEVFAQAVARRRIAQPSVSLQKVGILNATLGDDCVPAIAGMLKSGVDEVTCLIGKLSNEGAIELAAALKTSARMPSLVALASQEAGDAALVAFEDMWSRPLGVGPKYMDLALGRASPEVLDAMNVTRIRPMAASESATFSSEPRRLRATENFSEFLDEVLFPRLMLRHGTLTFL